MFRIFRIVSVVLVTSLAIISQQIDLKLIGTLPQQQVLLVALLLFLGLTNILIEILDHLRQKKEVAKRQKEFQNLKYQLSRPILPFTLRSVFKFSTNQSSINNVFGPQIAAFQKIIDKHKHEGKFISPDLMDFPWDENHQVTEYILCRLGKEALEHLSNSQNEHKAHILKSPFQGKLSFHKKTKKGHSSEPDLILNSTIHVHQEPPFKIVDLRLYNENLYLESLTYNWIIETNTDQLVSIYDLRGALMKLEFNVLTYDDEDFRKPPYFTLIQFKCGDRPFNIVELDLKTLGKPRISKNEGFNFEGNTGNLLGNILSIYYEVVLPDSDLENHMQQFN